MTAACYDNNEQDSGGAAMSSQNRNGKNDLGYWIAAVILLMSGVAAPIGFLMIVLKLLGGRKRGRHPYYTQQENQGPTGVRTTAAPSQAAAAQPGTAGPAKSRGRRKNQQDRIAALTAKGKKLTVIGGVITGLFGFATMMQTVEYLWVLPDVTWLLEETVPLLCFTCGGLGCLWAGIRKRKQAQRYRNYLAMIGRRQTISVSSLASATGSSAGKVREDLEDMLGCGLLPLGFLDYGSDTLVLSADGLNRDQPPKEAEKSKPTPHEEENAILAEIRAVNDAVENEKLSAQIDRIGVITAKILDYQKNHPEKAPQLHSFLSYYLPTTLKILRAYGQLEAQEVSGENITAAMHRSESMMDKVVEGFEKQLDQLFQTDAMDITTDVEVLERMLSKDGLSNSQGLTLGL